jgi:hypothetical protein
MQKSENKFHGKNFARREKNVVTKKIRLEKKFCLNNIAPKNECKE